MTPNHLAPLLALLLPLAACAPDPTTTAAPAAPRPQAAAASLTVQADVKEAVRQLTSPEATTRVLKPGPTAGSQLVLIEGGASQVTVARTAADGTVRTGCVNTAEAAGTFLEGTAPSGPARADR